MNIIVRKYEEKYLEEMIKIWNEVVETGIAFPQMETLSLNSAKNFFDEQTYTAIAIDEEKSEVLGLYILHPNNVGRCGHICNSSYAVKKDCRGLHIGEKLVIDSLFHVNTSCGTFFVFSYLPESSNKFTIYSLSLICKLYSMTVLL